MDIDDQTPSNTLGAGALPAYPFHPTNALAGPSTPHVVAPSLFLPPPAILIVQTDPPRPAPNFRSTDDLLSRFQLLAAYDRYVRPYSGSLPPTSTDKGKGKERELPQKDTPTLPPNNDLDDEDGTGKGEKKWKNNYRHLIKGIPGKHSMKKDDYLTNMIQVPPKQRNNITPLDLRTQREAFSVSLEGLKGWNINVLVAESPQAREDRKRRKELKKQAKAQQMTGVTPGAAASAGNSVPTVVGTPGASGHPPVARSSTPRPGSATSSRSGIPMPAQNSTQPRGTPPAGVGTPRSVSTPGVTTTGAPPTANPAMPTSTSAPSQLGVQTPGSVPVIVSMPGGGGGPEVKRGVKRERDDSVNGTGVRPVNGSVQPVEAASTGGKPHVPTGAKAGMNGIRPRPLKKQRVLYSQSHLPSTLLDIIVEPDTTGVTALISMDKQRGLIRALWAKRHLVHHHGTTQEVNFSMYAFDSSQPYSLSYDYAKKKIYLSSYAAHFLLNYWTYSTGYREALNAMHGLFPIMDEDQDGVAAFVKDSYVHPFDDGDHMGHLSAKISSTSRDDKIVGDIAYWFSHVSYALVHYETDHFLRTKLPEGTGLVPSFIINCHRQECSSHLGSNAQLHHLLMSLQAFVVSSWRDAAYDQITRYAGKLNLVALLAKVLTHTTQPGIDGVGEY
ncbi:hypothetical protein EUX98_g9306 [Antrodiella citrinella]|uniref:Mediator of RNA polymerase II transcription subunit 19 n=1 Tax=Antrodiella citrinella TaxID=2447956 RepID=A0A4S4LWZ0_9APHY|nr:hypothetical protein EUX98_g9306 [Antrodiella citrinella]